jgi:uncharacterized membrane protein
MDFALFKAKAREKLSGNWPVLVVITIIVLIATSTDAGNTTTYIRNGIEINVKRNYGSIISLIFGGPVLLGAANVYLDLIKNNQVRIERFFDGFKRFGDAFVLNILITLFIILWSLLLIIPGIIAAIRYSMAYLIMSENPEVGPMEAINRSKILMAGHKGEFFSFVISFIGWFLLSIVTIGFGFLFLIPYYNASKIYFYKSLTGEPIDDSDEYDYIVESKPEYEE